jgi:hypothetical protein
MMIFFITENYLKDKTPITRNIDAADITPFIYTASDMYMKDILGSYFYEDILNKYNTQNLNPDETVLVSLVQPAIAWYAASFAVKGVHYSLRNKGIQLQDGENSTAASQNEVVMTAKDYKQTGDFYTERLRKYLILNKDLFSVFTNKLNTDSCLTDITPRKDDGYNSDMLMI